MSAAKHTWVVADLDDETSQINVMTDDGFYIAGVIGGFSDPSKQKAHARLIAAAPDLKEVAEEAIEALSFAMRSTSDAEQSDKYAATINRLTDAVAKAGA